MPHLWLPFHEDHDHDHPHVIIKPVNEIPHNGGVRMKRGTVVENQRAAGRQGGHLLYLTPLIIIVIIVIIMVIIIGKPKWWNCLAIMMIKTIHIDHQNHPPSNST